MSKSRSKRNLSGRRPVERTDGGPAARDAQRDASAAPADLGPVDDGEHSTTNFDYYRSPAEIPSTWRRWPMDIVVTANDVAADVDRLSLTPSRLEKFLHKGQPIAHRAPRDPAPFTWRGALPVLNTIER
ncbi:MAG TPA: hypothetical protein PKY73_16585, partial [Hyphomonas sp.]|nr:hypothetical protein [Hyphomonas sp.]